MTIIKKESELINRLLEIDDIYERFQFIIDQKNESYKLNESQKIDKNRVYGCQSELWIVGAIENNFIEFNYYSPGLFPNGLTKVLIDIINGARVDEVIEFYPTFLEKTNLLNFISPNRKIGFESLMKKVKEIAKNTKK